MFEIILLPQPCYKLKGVKTFRSHSRRRDVVVDEIVRYNAKVLALHRSRGIFKGMPLMCERCGRENPTMFMLKDEVWEGQLGLNKEFLCISCTNYIMKEKIGEVLGPDDLDWDIPLTILNLEKIFEELFECS